MHIPKKKTQMSVQEADEMIRLRDQLLEEYKGVKRSNLGTYNKYKKQEQPMIDAINNLGDKLEKVIEHEHSTSLDSGAQLLPLRPITSTYVTPTNVTSEPTSKPASIRPITQHAVSSIGPTVAKYLALSKQKNAGDSVFGFYGGDDGTIRMGDSEVIFDNDNLIIKGIKYKATPGLMALLTMKDVPNNLDETDLLNYGQILTNTNCMYQNNDPTTRRPKSSVGQKYNSTIKPIWELMTKGVSRKKQYFSPSRKNSFSDSDTGSGRNSPIDPTFGSGVHKYTELPKEYVWMNDVRKLVDRLVVILGEEESGNDNLYNEKVSIMKMFNDTLSNFILQDPKNIGHLIKIINMLPPKFWAKQGSGFVNDLLSIKGMPELHVPGYNFCGPYTKLDERLARGDQGINPLDEACKQHDIAYRDHKDIESRHAADKILEDKAWGRVFNSKSSIGEKLASVGTAMVMNRKIAYGWGWT